jgi:NTP pyrophosphatase (non-canonical NTP hydrolase)
VSLENRKKVRVGDVENVLGSLQQKLRYRIKQYGDHGYASVHEILGQVTEEYLELAEAIRTDKHDLRYEIYGELMDLMVACLWGCLSIGQDTIDW